MISDINAAIEQNDFQRVKTLVEAVVEEVGENLKASSPYPRHDPTVH